MSLAKELINEFFGIPICISSDLVTNFINGLDHEVEDYIKFVSSCGNLTSHMCFSFSRMRIRHYDLILDIFRLSQDQNRATSQHYHH